LLFGPRKDVVDPSAIATLSIELLPEFGWSIGKDNQRAFGPGTIFQGFVVVKCHEFSEKASCLHLVFQGVEVMLTFDSGPGIIRSSSNELFRSRIYLWKPTATLNSLKPAKTYKFKFTVQMPLVQFPPSMNHEYYRCTYSLIARLDVPSDYCYEPVIAISHIKYIPLTETKLLKAPIFLSDLKKKKKASSLTTLTASVILHSVEYVSGSTIQATVSLKGHLNAAQSSNDVSIVMTLYQVSKFNADTEPILVNSVATQTHVIRNLSDYSSNGEKKYKLTVPIDETLPPSFKYGMVMCLSYKLKIKVFIQKSQPADKLNTTTLSTEIGKYSADNSSSNSNKKRTNLKKYLELLRSTVIAEFETPIVVATLDRGIRAGDELNDYSKYKTDKNCMPRPRFVKSEEYQDALPIYDDIRLPSYSKDARQLGDCSSIAHPTLSTPKSKSLIIYTQGAV
ncbi:hypothetical protein INT47_003632, partial [Mucor saturninus]